MTPDQWERVKQIFEVALECAPDKRAEFLEGACGRDEDLRREVESLLSSDESAGSFIEKPAVGTPALPPSDGQPEMMVGRLIGP